MSGSVGAYVAQVDRVLSAGVGLFPQGGGAGSVDAGSPVVPGAPAGGRLQTGVDGAGDSYRQGWRGVSALDADTNTAATDGRTAGEQGRGGASGVRDAARTQAAAIAPATGSPAGTRLMVSTMDERLAAMQQQIDTTKAQNKLLATRLRQVAQAYRASAMSGGGRGPMMPGGMGMPSFGGRGGSMPGGGGIPSFGSGIPGLSSLSAGGRSSGGRSPGGGLGLANIPQAAIPLSQVSFAGKGAWPSGERAMRGYVEEALDAMGIHDPRARANWMPGMLTIADHESSSRTEAINLTDSNAHGPRQEDGGPLHSTRGPWQVMPDTFARFHQPGTSNSVWDPVANAAASMNYQMHEYGVARDGHNQRALIGQANPGVRRGY